MTVPTVRTVTYDLLRSLGMTTIFGNPGSTEEPFLTEFPADFQYILGLHEAVVVAMADGYAQASGNAAFVNLHTASGVGNGMGSLVTAWHNRTPLVVTAGQQTRQMLALEPWLVNREAPELPRPYVKWSHEPARPEDVPGAIERAYHIAMTPPRGPVFVSIPMDDWDGPTEPRLARRVDSRYRPSEEALTETAEALAAATNPVLVVGGGVDRAGGWDAAVQLAERLNVPVWEAPAAERASFPQDHRLFQGAMPLAMKPLAERLQGHDVVLVAGAPIFRYYPHIPGPILPPGTRLVHITDDPQEAARAPAGDSIVGDVRVALERLVSLVPEVNRAGPKARPAPRAAPPSDPILVAYAMKTLAEALPDNTPITEESASSRAAFYDQIRIRRPGTYFATASGGLGFALPAAVGVGLARPDRPVVCIVGDGAAMFGIQAIWTAARHEIPVVFVVIDNGQYGILKAFAAFQRTPGVPGLDLPGLDVAMVARGLGAESRRITSANDLPEAYREAFHTAETRRCPVLLDVVVDPEVGALFSEPVD
ncbi:MAG TPA: benzoylformate decarboxylase [Thermomicrobiales bacterium]|nr:benzoylformate decarboxylase [Thermomicrobiales bacterium]